VSVDDASNYAEQNNVSFLESSALNNHNVATAFLHLVTDIYETLYSKLGDLEKPEVPGGAVPIVLDAEPILPTEPPPVGQKQVPTKQEKKCCT
jgi:hypothetical protein